MAEQIPVLSDALGGVAGAAAASVTEGMIQRLAVMAERSVTALDAVTDPEVLALLQQLRASAPALTKTLKRLDDLNTSGALDTLLELAEIAQVFRVSMGDSMVARMADMVRQLGEMADLLLTSGLPKAAPALMQAVGAAQVDAAKDPSSIGLMGLVRSLREPQIQFALKFVLALARRLPEATK
jgi:uncharacterized protein YjgD (DUF1641 family)